MLTVDINIAVDQPALPGSDALREWATLAYRGDAAAELALSIVDEDAITQLNGQYRDKPQSTNVLSFPANAEPVDGTLHLGDVILCAKVIAREAAEQDKPPQAHWAHMVVHGVLHLQGFDHIDEKDAMAMESLEIQLLAQLGYPNPYETQPIAQEAKQAQ